MLCWHCYAVLTLLCRADTVMSCWHWYVVLTLLWRLATIMPCWHCYTVLTLLGSADTDVPCWKCCVPLGNALLCCADILCRTPQALPCWRWRHAVPPSSHVLTARASRCSHAAICAASVQTPQTSSPVTASYNRLGKKPPIVTPSCNRLGKEPPIMNVSCLNVTLHVVDLWQYYVCCIRSGVIRCTLPMVHCLYHMYQWGYTRCIGFIVYLCASTLQNVAVSQDFYSLPIISVERSCWPCIRWYWTLGFKSRANAFLLSFLSLGWYYYRFFLLAEMVSTLPRLCIADFI